MKEKRAFLGARDSQKIVLQPVFYGSPLIAVAPIEAPTKTCLHVEGPIEHLQFLFPYLVRLVKQSPVDPDDRWGTWTGVEGYEAIGKLTLFYSHGNSFSDRARLLQQHFRRDVAFYCGLRLADTAFLDVTLRDKSVLHEVIGLPEELEQNGSVAFPLFT